MTKDALGTRVQSVARAEVVESDLKKYDRRSQQWMPEGSTRVARVVALIGKDHIRGHLDLAAEELPPRRELLDETCVHEGAQTNRGVAGEFGLRRSVGRESIPKKARHSATLSMFALTLLSIACGDDTTVDVGADSGDDVPALADAAHDMVDLADAVEDVGAAACDEAVPVRRGAIADPDLDELSGLVASRTQPGIYFAINDSGPADLFAIDESGAALGRYRLEGANNRDFEDITIGPGPGGDDYVYIGDVGDNGARTGADARDEVQIYAVPEPVVGESLSTLTGVLTYRYTYEEPVDVEAIALDSDGSLLMLTKENGTSRLLTAPLQEGPTRDDADRRAPVPAGDGNGLHTRRSPNTNIRGHLPLHVAGRRGDDVRRRVSPRPRRRGVPRGSRRMAHRWQRSGDCVRRRLGSCLRVRVPMSARSER